MFSKITSHAASSPSHLHTSATASLVDLNDRELLLYHHDMLSSHHQTAAAAPLYDSTIAASVFDGGELLFLQPQPMIGDLQTVTAAAPSAAAKASKKKNHSKIETAKGPRERRVRLSKCVARKFFNLHESLGFDQPSKTIDWLLTKSETAINDLKRDKAAKSGSGKEDKRRMAARDRARERTREKKRNKELLEATYNNISQPSPLLLLHHPSSSNYGVPPPNSNAAGNERR